MQKDPTNDDVAERIRIAFERKVKREAAAGRRYTKALLARRMDESPQAVQHWFVEGFVEKLKLPRVARELETSVDWLLSGEQDLESVVITSKRFKAIVEIFQELPEHEQDRIFREIQDAEQRRREKIDILLAKN